MGSSILVVRADASVAIGTGHVMRGLALSQAWQSAGGKVVFAMAQSTPAIEQRLRSESFELVKLDVTPGAHDAQQLAEVSRAQAADCVVLDGYQFDGDYQHRIKDAGFRLLSVDDNGHADHYFADVVLNHNPHACSDLFHSREPYTRLLLGPRYALLRREFERWQNWTRPHDREAHKVLVTMGGSDPDNVTATVIRVLSQVKVKSLDVTVVVGGSNPHLPSLKSVAAEFSGTIRLQQGTTNMSDLLAWADVAVSGAGTTCWEMCLLGLPMILIDLAENQRQVAIELDRCGAAVHLGGTQDVLPEKIAARVQQLLQSSEQRAEMSRQSRRLVDGKGAPRVVSALRGGVHLRRAAEQDARLLWEWANDPAVRAASFTGGAIPWERHQEWFRSRFVDGNTLLYVALDPANRPVGQVRYELEGSKATVSISLSAGHRDLGYGNAILAQGTEELFRNTAATAIDAFVKPDNDASRRLFARAGFSAGPVATIRGQTALRYTLQKKGAS